MREDFRDARQHLDGIGILKVCSDFYMKPAFKWGHYFVKSPCTKDRTFSLCLYPESNRYYDFAGNKSGDIISLVAYVRNINQWGALQELKAFYSLSGNNTNSQKRREEIKRQQAQENQKRQRQQAFKEALRAHIVELKRWEHIYTLALEKRLYEPYSELWTYCHNELCQIRRKLDILTAADQATYRRMKAVPRLGLSSDKPLWLLDTISVLAEDGVFAAADSEIARIKEQINIELKRWPGG